MVLSKFRDWRAARRIRHLRHAENCFRNRDFPGVYYHLGVVTGSSSWQVRRSFEIAALFKGKTSFELLREALEPRLQS
jgi:hypothetical protein